jgi:hypothetical protein
MSMVGRWVLCEELTVATAARVESVINPAQ